MKLCQKCIDQVSKIGPDTADEVYWTTIKAIPESKCQFWAHKEANMLNEALSSEVGLF